jgi:glycosyltransferase involved in cell wall biosynthesis
MRCPKLSEIPSPANSRSGWPWTEETPYAPDRMANGSEWPLISVVTPNFNYERYLETTIRSVLLQGYPNVEYIVQDDGSTDGSVDLIRKYEKFLSHWSSEPNAGQVPAINRGMRRAKGSILCYINSDDYFMPGAFRAAAEFFHKNPDVDIANGRCRVVDENEKKIGDHFGDIRSLDEVLDLWDVWWAKRQFVQPETFWRQRVYETIGDFRNDLYIVFDYEYWVRAFGAGFNARPLDYETAAFRIQPNQKTSNAERVAREEIRVVNEWIWDPRTPISKSARRQLQGKWIFDAVFRKTADESVAKGEGRLQRWWKLGRLLTKYPQMLTTRQFFDRLFRRKNSGNAIEYGKR